MKRKQVYLFGCIEKNIGDDLFIYIVCKRYPNIDFIISDEANYLKINNISNLKYNSTLKKWLIFANKESKNIIKKSICFFIEKIFRINLKKLDSIYIVGNAFKNMNYKGSYQIEWLNKRISLSNNFFLISTNFGPANNANWKNDCSKVFSRMTDVCFRDMISYNTFKELGNVRYAPDAVLSFKPKEKKECMLNKKKYIIFSTIDCLMNGRNEELKKSAYTYEKKMVELINEYNINNTKVVILNSNTKQDEPSSMRIYDKCAYKDMVSIYNYDGNLEKIFNLFENAKAIIATRLHTIILAWIYNIPVIPVIYDIKVKNLLKSYKFSGLKGNINNLKNLNYSIVNQYINNYSYRISKKIIEDSNKQFEMIDKILKQEEHFDGE